MLLVLSLPVTQNVSQTPTLRRRQTRGECAKETYLATGGNRARRVPASILRVLALVVLSLVGSGQDTRGNICPGSVVQRLLLAPKEIGVRVLVKVRSDLGIRKHR